MIVILLVQINLGWIYFKKGGIMSKKSGNELINNEIGFVRGLSLSKLKRFENRIWPNGRRVL